MKGLYLQTEGTIFRGTKPQFSKLLKGITKGVLPATPTEGLVEVGPILFNLDTIKPDEARDLFTKIQLGE